MRVNPVSYVQVGKRTWRVYLLGRFAGHVIKGAVSAYLRPRAGRGILFPDLIAAERQLAAIGQRMIDESAERIRAADEEHERQLAAAS